MNSNESSQSALHKLNKFSNLLSNKRYCIIIEILYVCKYFRVICCDLTNCLNHSVCFQLKYFYCWMFQMHKPHKSCSKYAISNSYFDNFYAPKILSIFASFNCHHQIFRNLDSISVNKFKKKKKFSLQNRINVQIALKM